MLGSTANAAANRQMFDLDSSSSLLLDREAAGYEHGTAGVTRREKKTMSNAFPTLSVSGSSMP